GGGVCSRMLSRSRRIVRVTCTILPFSASAYSRSDRKSWPSGEPAPEAPSLGNRIQGNKIGTDAPGRQALGNGRNGVFIVGARASDNTIGGRAAGAANTIAFNARDGVLVDGGVGNAITRNAIFANGNLGIELVNGGNHLQPAPVLTGA